MLDLEYPRTGRWVPWLLMPWLRASPNHYQPWYWLCSMKRTFSLVRYDFNNLHQHSVVDWYKVLIFVCVPWKQIQCQGLSTKNDSLALGTLNIGYPLMCSCIQMVLILEWVKFKWQCITMHWSRDAVKLVVDINGLAQDCSNSIAIALELLQSCTKTLM